jgi:pimeloyl-ACP methyl ester carboxylesterase
MSTTVQTAVDIRSFHVEISDEHIDDLRRRIEATRWPTQELVDDRSQGVQLATLRALADYWKSGYDLGRIEARLNALPQFTTEIDGVDVHFIHVRSQHEDALPLIMTHGWPGSVIEQIDAVRPLTDPTAHGGSAEDAFHLVLPSLPGYGFSSQPAEPGWNLGRVARAWAELMKRLGYDRYVAQGGDVGAGVTDAMGRLGPEGLIGIHTNLLVPALNDPAALPADSEQEQVALAAIKTFQTSGNGYFVEQATRPQTIGYALLDSPVSLAAWMIDHDTDAYYKISGAFVDGRPSGNLTRDNILDNITLYWLTGTGASAAGRIGRPTDRTPPGPARTRRRTFGSRSPSRRSPARSGGRLAAGSRSRTRTSSTSTRSTRAGTSRRGRSRRSSRPRCGRRSGHCADRRVRAARANGARRSQPVHGARLRSLATAPLRRTTPQTVDCVSVRKCHPRSVAYEPGRQLG